MFGQDRASLRQVYVNAWHKKRNGTTLSPLDALISDIIDMHPEYHAVLENKDAQDKDYTPEMGQTNPFLHMGMHIAIREQVITDKPAGIKPLYKQLCDKHYDIHKAEHTMMECLGEVLFNAQSSGGTPDEAAYLKCLKQLR